MRPINRHPRRGAPSRFLLLGTTAIVLGAIATVGTLLALGVLHFGGPRHVYYAGRIPVPCCLHTIPAYTLVTPGYVTTPDTGDRWMEPGKIPKTVITDRRQIFFRVASRQKEMGYLFSEEDFTPKGTRPGVAAGVPEGKRAITLQADKLDGVYGLALGDHVDLVASIPVDKLSSFGGADWSRLPASAQTQAQVVPRDDKTKEKRTETRMLARDAVLVTPVTTRLKSITSSSLTQGTTVRQVPVHEIVLAVDEDEVAPLTDAMGLAVAITCVAHSGRPEDKNRNAVPPGMVAVPVNGRAVAAYNLLMPEDLLDPGTRAQKYVTLAADEVRQRGIVVDSKTVVGRVLARDKSRGQFFSEDDFLPPGTAPGLAGGIPPDKRALTLDASKVNGARALRLGDHFDLMASMPIDLTRTGGQGGSIQLMGASLQKQAAVRALVQDGVVVMPVASPTMAAIEAASGDSKQTGREMVVAVAAEEVPHVAEALALGLELAAVVRSGNPRDSSKNVATPDDNPLARVQAVESIVGHKRQTLVFQAAEAAPAETVRGRPTRVLAQPAAGRAGAAE